MQFSFALIALVASATTVVSSPVRKIAKRGMHLRFSFYTLNSTVIIGGPEVCTLLLNGTGFADNQVTKDCCAAVHHKAFYNEVQKECTPNSGIYGNSVVSSPLLCL
jgi:hypothetical protein